MYILLNVIFYLFPFADEHTRVILDVPGDQAEEFNYINANYIRVTLYLS